MSVDQKIRERLAELVTMGESVLATRQEPPRGVVGDPFVDAQLAFQWATSAQNLLARVFGKDSEHYANFRTQVEKHLTFSPVRNALGVLRAAHDDFEQGQLFDLRRLIEADVFVSFLEQSEHLLEAGYYQAAAVLAGGVLEDSLRKLCESAGITLASRPKLDSMNIDLAKAGLYSKLVQKRITVCGVAQLLVPVVLQIDDCHEPLLSARRFLGVVSVRPRAAALSRRPQSPAARSRRRTRTLARSPGAA
ncbi:MAG: DUF4145 domain-containing protein [Thermoleophilia bacterium]|nr:DUF4145 domain-containing protein [Thermoleophilia bacterium]